MHALKSTFLCIHQCSLQRVRVCLPFLLLMASATAIAADGPDTNWQLSPFVRPPNASPIITPLKDTLFHGPLSRTPVRWESLHTFNPGAIVRDGKIYVLYRAEDDSGQMKIGGHTSRIGLAVSEDGIHFQREPNPVLYPADDDQKEREWPGGCEDPRVVEAEDGSYVVAYTQWNHSRYDAAASGLYLTYREVESRKISSRIARLKSPPLPIDHGSFVP